MRFSVEDMSFICAAARPATADAAPVDAGCGMPVARRHDRLAYAPSDIATAEAPAPELPAWTAILNEYLAAVAGKLSAPAANEPAVAVPNHPRPFEDILLPFVTLARQRLMAMTGKDYHLLSKAAHTALERSLLFWLVELNALPMQLEFAVFRENSLSGLYRALLPVGPKPPDTCYRRFLQGLREGGLKAYLQEYPILARLLATGTDQWLAVASELINRLKHDEAGISAVFHAGQAPGQVTELQPNCSDRHQDGRSVMILRFESGLKLVYKPRDIGLEQAFVSLAGWLNKRGAPHTFKTFKVLSRQAYGWAEFIPVSPIPDRTAAQTYYRRAGSLLCLAHVLGATDMHLENIIGHGAYPVLIDLETLMHPFARQAAPDSGDATHKAGRVLYESVIRTGMLPRWYTDEQDQAYDVSMLGAGMRQDLQLEWIRWKAVNTDDMTARKEKLSMFPPRDTSSAPGFDSADFKAEMVQGFRDTYRFFIRHRSEMLDSPCWKALSGQSIRFVFRPTKVYTRLLKNLLQPKLLKNGADRSRYLDRLYNGTETDDADLLWRPLVALEQAALERMDVPHFTTRTDATSLLARQVYEIPGYFGDTAFDQACSRLLALDEQDLQRQVSFITGSLTCRAEVKTHTDTPLAGDPVKGSALLTPAMALEEAASIAATLMADAVRGADGSTTWIAPRPIPGSGKHQLDPVPHDLFAGNAGIALFFAGLYRLTGSPEYNAMTADTLQTLVRCLEADAPAPYAPKSAGGFCGWGGLAYSLLKTQILTGNASFGTAAVKAAARITPAMIDADKAFDLMNGVAGAILSLAKLYEYQQDPGLLQTLNYAGNHLLRQRQPTPAGFRTWRMTSGPFLTGYSHGAAGIAQALLRLYKLTGREAFREAALEAIAWEDSVFNPDEKNWPDFRDTEQKCMRAWCHGAAGIGLGRLEAMDICPLPAIESDIGHAIVATRASLNAATDYICCGNFGRLELLVSASQQLHEPAWRQEALMAAGTLLQRAKRDGAYRYHPAIGYTPSFFQGLSGIGYQLLRMTHPDVLPAILTLS